MIIQKSDFEKKYPSIVAQLDFQLVGATQKKIAQLASSDIIAIYYMYDDIKVEIFDINKIEIIQEITLEIYNNTSQNLPRIYATFLRFPFDTQIASNYLLLKYICRRSDKALEEVKQLFKHAQIEDLKRAKQIATETNFNNTFEIYDRNSFVNAINHYLYANDKIRSIVITITDTLAGWYKRNRNKNLYGQVISKVVTLLTDGNGGIIQEGNYFTYVRYLFGGIKSSLVGLESDDSELFKKKELATKLYRENISYKDIYLQTGWFYNKFDSQWRFLIPDNKAELTTWAESNNIFAVKGSRAYGLKDVAYRNISSGDTRYCKTLLNDGWDCKLSDVLDHPILYKHYEELFSLPVFFIHTTSTPNFYYTDEDKYILICGNPQIHNLRSILLHEIQHAIQNIEGYGSGGNETFANIVSSLGGEGLREFLGTLKQAKSLFQKEFKEQGDYSYARFSLLFGSGSISQTVYYNSATDILFTLAANIRLNAVSTFLKNTDLEDYVGILGKYSQVSEAARAKLKAKGYSQKLISGILFSNYELLLGELESRNVQAVEKFDENELSYFLPLTTEGYDEKRVVVHTNKVGEQKPIPVTTNAAIERSMDKYIFHLSENRDIKPFLHELGHLIYDIIDPDWATNIINNIVDLNILKKYNYDREEIFCNLFLCYLASLNIEESFTKKVIPNQELMGFEMDFVPKFNSIFQGENTSKTLQMLSQMKDFVNLLNSETV